MAFTTLIDTRTLADHLADPAFAVVDCRFSLDDESWGERNYLEGHIPGAAYAHLDRDLSGTKTGSNGRHPLPSAHELTDTLSRLGIDQGIQVVAYDQDTGMYASRFWWLLRWMGHGAVAVLDGGFAKWTAEGLPTARGEESRPPRAFRGAPVAGMVVNVNEVAALAHRTDWRLVDARAPERFRGEIEPIDRAGGHIPGAVNHFFKRNLAKDGTFLAPDALRARLRQATERGRAGSHRLLLRIWRHRLPESARARARRPRRRQAVPRIVERVVERSGETDRDALPA